MMTTAIESTQESEEYYSEILEILKGRVRRCGGSCQVSTLGMVKLVRTRFGLTGQAARHIRDSIIERLVSEKLLVFWDGSGSTRKRNSIYQTNIKEWTKRFGTI